MAALHVTGKNFESEVLQSDVPVLVDFWASWCGPCKILLPIIEELSNEATDFKVGKVNTDEEQELAARFQIMTIPTFLVFKNGELVNKSVGVISKEAILKLVHSA